MKAGHGIGVGGNVRHLPQSASDRLRHVLLVVGRRVELAGAAAPACLVEWAAPRIFLEVKAFLRLEHRRAADRRQRRQRRGKAACRLLVDAARERAAVAARYEVRHPQSQRAVLDRRVHVAGAGRCVGLARAEALGDDRPEMVRDHLVKSPRRVPEVRRRDVDHQLGLGRHRVNDLEVEDRLTFRFHRSAPARVLLDREHLVERRQAELGCELVEVAHVGQVIDLGKHDRLPRSVQAGVAQRFQVVVREHVGRHEAAWVHRVPARPPVVVEAAHVRDHGGEGRRKHRLVERGVEHGAAWQPIGLDVDPQQRGHSRSGPVGRDQA